MAFYERRRKTAAAGRKRPDISRCKRHPKHHQSPGVCSLCLHEKLSKICSGSSRSSSSSSSSSSSKFFRMQYYYYSSGLSSSSSLSPSSSSGSSMASPVHRYDRNVLVKSRSIAFVSRKGREVNRDNEGSDDKRLGFWWRLISNRQEQKTIRNDNVGMG